jgi:hypothetical protein
MKAHKYRVGQTVHYHPARGFDGRPGDFRIERLLPPDAAGNQYCLESIVDGQRRVVQESEITLRSALSAAR